MARWMRLVRAQAEQAADSAARNPGLRPPGLRAAREHRGGRREILSAAERRDRGVLAGGGVGARACRRFRARWRDLPDRGEFGSYLDSSALRRRYKEALSRAGLRALGFHDLRHTFGTRMIAKARRVDGPRGHPDHDADPPLRPTRRRRRAGGRGVRAPTARAAGHLRTSRDILGHVRSG